MKKYILLGTIMILLLGACEPPVTVPTTLPSIPPMGTGVVPVQPKPTEQLTTIATDPVPPLAENIDSEPNQIYQFRMITQAVGWSLGGIAGENPKVLRTMDGAATWLDTRLPLETSSDQGSASLAGFFLNEQMAWVAPYMTALPPFREQNIWKTMDGGTTWNRTSLDTEGLQEAFSISHIQFIDELNGWLLAHVGAGMNHDYIVIYRTIDGGTSWEKIVDPTTNDAGIQSCQKNGLVFADSQNGWLTGSCNGVTPGALLFRTQDGGKTWINIILPDPQSQTGLFQNFDAICGSQFPNAQDTNVQVEVACKMMSASLDQPAMFLYSSSDAGLNWKLEDIPVGKVTYLPEDGILIQGDKTMLSWDSGNSWIDLPDAPQGISAQFLDKNIGWILSATGDLFISMVGGTSWV